MQHARNVGPILFACNENIAYIMPRGTVHAVTSCMHCTARAHRQVMGVLFTQAKQHLRKLTASQFSTLNVDFANQNVLERILIAMLNENKADWNGNFRICAEEPVAPLYER